MTLLFVYATLAIFFSFLCSILEATLLSVTPTYLRLQQQQGKRFATALSKLKEDIDQPLVAILTLNTIAHTVGAILVGVQADQLPYQFDLFGINLVAIVSAVMTLLILVVSEIIPKTIGATYWQQLAPFTAISLKLIILPLKYTGTLWILTQTTKLIGKAANNESLSREEFIAITDAAEQEGVFAENESTIIKNLLIFKSVFARDVMTPFPVVFLENEETTLNAFYESHSQLRFSRIPIYKDRSHNITGFVLKDDILEQIVEANGDSPLSEFRRDLLVISDDNPIPELFDKFIKNRAHIALVVDNFGNTIGIVTMEDIIETLLGLEIMDESDNVTDMQILARRSWERRAKRMGIELAHKDDETEAPQAANQN